MADNVLNATITADGSSFSKTLAQLEKQLKAFQAGLKNAGSAESFARLNRAAEATKARIDALKKSGTEAGNALARNVAPGANQAGNALTNLGRIAQDAPFGFIGIQNNINPLLESFQRLKAETGSAGGALKALGGSLIGAGGIGLAISVVTGLLTVFSKEIFGSGSAADSADGRLQAYGQTLDTIKEKVQALSSAVQFANQLGGINVKIAGFGSDIGNELTDLRQQSIAQEELTGKIIKQREEAVRVSIAIGNDEKLSGEKRVEATQKAAEAIANIDEKILESTQKQRLLYRQIALQKLEDQKEADAKAKAAADKAAADYEKYVNDTIANAKKLSSYLNEATFRNFDIDFNPLDSLKTQFEQARKFIERATNDRRSFAIKINAVPQVNFDVSGAAFRESIAESVLKINEGIQKEIPGLTKRNPILIQMSAVLQGFYDFEEKMRRAAEDLARTVQGAFQNAFVGLAQGIGEAIGGEDIGKALFSVIGDLITQIGKALIQYGIVKAGLDKILSAGGIAIPGGAAIALGAFAIAIGGLIKNTRVKGQRALGGSVTGGSPYLVGERGQEVFVPNTSGRIVPNSALGGSVSGRGAQQIYGQFRIAGNDLIAVVANTSRSQRRLS